MKAATDHTECSRRTVVSARFFFLLCVVFLVTFRCLCIIPLASHSSIFTVVSPVRLRLPVREKSETEKERSGSRQPNPPEVFYSGVLKECVRLVNHHRYQACPSPHAVLSPPSSSLSSFSSPPRPIPIHTPPPVRRLCHPLHAPSAPLQSIPGMANGLHLYMGHLRTCSLRNSDLVQPVWCSYGLGARPATLIAPDGSILFQQLWLHTGRMAHELNAFFGGDDALDQYPQDDNNPKDVTDRPW